MRVIRGEREKSGLCVDLFDFRLAKGFYYVGSGLIINFSFSFLILVFWWVNERFIGRA